MTNQSNVIRLARCWLTGERLEWLALTLAAGLIGFSVGNGHTTQNAIQHVADRAGCEQWRAEKAVKAAKQGVEAATTFSVNPPDPKAIPTKDPCQ